MSLSGALVWAMREEEQSTCGHCPCSIAMVGAMLGHQLPFVAPIYVFARYLCHSTNSLLRIFFSAKNLKATYASQSSLFFLFLKLEVYLYKSSYSESCGVSSLVHLSFLLPFLSKTSSFNLKLDTIFS